MVTVAERFSDILMLAGVLSLLIAFLSYAVGVLIHYGTNKRLIEDIGGHSSSIGFLMFPVMLLECIAARRLYKTKGKAVPRTLQIEICCYLASLILLVVSAIAGLSSGFILERIP